MKEGNQEAQKKYTPKQAQRPSFWRLLVWVALAWMLGMYLSQRFGDPNQVEISYSRFKKQLEEGNVQEVTIEGNNIRGRFSKPYQPEQAEANAEEDEKDARTYKRFATVKPPFEDPELMGMLDEKQVIIRAKEQDGSWWSALLISLLPWLLIIGFFVFMSRRMQQQQQGGGMPGMGGLFSVGKSKAKRYRESIHDTGFDDVAGLENAKKDLIEIIQYLKDPKKFATLGARPPKGVLLVGPPGTGKTLLARATAGEAGVPFYSVSASQFIEMFVGVGASRVRDLFENAKREAPAIIFIDELDSVGRARGTGLGSGHDEREQTLNQILSEMDGFEPHESVIVLAATNRPDVLDSALTRPGRFDRQVVLDRPHKEARREILKIHTRDVPLADDVDLDNLAARTVGFSGADLGNLVNEAAMLAGREKKEDVDAEDFDRARDKILLGSEREDFVSDDEKRLIAYHEAGHAMVARLLPETDPLQKVTIIPRGRALGATEQVPETDKHHYRRRYLLNRIAVMLGGRAAESLVFDDLTNGAADDLKQATQLARQMVCQWGMSEKLGPAVFRQGEEHLFLGKEMAQQKDFSEHTAELIDGEIQRILREGEEEAVNLLEENRHDLDRLVEALVEDETLDADEIESLLHEEPPSPRRRASPQT
jgi:cell division protease FtsH